MKTSKLFRVLIALLLLAPLSLMTSCTEEDAPELSHSLDELSGSWVWDFNDGTSPFDVTVTKNSSSEITIENFHNMGGETITMKVSGTALSFSGELAGGELKITEGTGSIINGWEGMTLSYLGTDGDGEQRYDITLTKGNVVSKKAKFNAQ
ncbi:MAG: hypothetical protein IIT83_00345 [Bacteroidales bacterium]|nr:hypothetical protein [Bacteroidales bacterium]